MERQIVKPVRFRVIKNPGRADGYTNACMWISIRDFLWYARGEQWNIRDLRDLAGFRAGPNDDYNHNNRYHERALRTLLRSLCLNLTLYLNQDMRGGAHVGPPVEYQIFLNRYETRNCQGRLNDINIISYGSHFELIVTINEIHLIDEAASAAGKSYIPMIYDRYTGEYTDKKISIPVVKKRASPEDNNDIDCMLKEISEYETQIASMKAALENYMFIVTLDEPTVNRKVIDNEISRLNIEIINLTDELLHVQNKFALKFEDVAADVAKFEIEAKQKQIDEDQKLAEQLSIKPDIEPAVNLEEQMQNQLNISYSRGSPFEQSNRPSSRQIPTLNLPKNTRSVTPGPYYVPDIESQTRPRTKSQIRPYLLPQSLPQSLPQPLPQPRSRSPYVPLENVYLPRKQEKYSQIYRRLGHKHSSPYDYRSRNDPVPDPNTGLNTCSSPESFMRFGSQYKEDKESERLAEQLQMEEVAQLQTEEEKRIIIEREKQRKLEEDEECARNLAAKYACDPWNVPGGNSNNNNGEEFNTITPLAESPLETQNDNEKHVIKKYMCNKNTTIC